MIPLLDERQRRLFLANEAKSYGYGGVSEVSRISGFSRTTITVGIKELESEPSKFEGKVRRKGGGRHNVLDKYGEVICEYIREIIEGKTYGDPMRPLSYTTESLRSVARQLLEKHQINIHHVTVRDLLKTMGYSKQVNQKMLQVGKSHPDRNAQFEHINATASEYLDLGEPVISVDTKKKELIGNFKNNGQEYRKIKSPRKVLDHDFPIKELGKISPYGVYNLNKNTGFVNIGTSHDTSEFAVESIFRWWKTVGKHTFPKAKKLLVTCDCGGSNGNRSRTWKAQLQQFADRTRIEVQVAHFPPGTSKWNKVEHRLFCYISKSWQGKPLIDIETVINLIGNTKTTKGLNVVCMRDDNHYKLSKKISDKDFEALSLEKDAQLEAWNYRIIPR